MSHHTGYVCKSLLSHPLIQFLQFKDFFVEYPACIVTSPLFADPRYFSMISSSEREQFCVWIPSTAPFGIIECFLFFSRIMNKKGHEIGLNRPSLTSIGNNSNGNLHSCIASAFYHTDISSPDFRVRIQFAAADNSTFRSNIENIRFLSHDSEIYQAYWLGGNKIYGYGFLFRLKKKISVGFHENEHRLNDYEYPKIEGNVWYFDNMTSAFRFWRAVRIVERHRFFLLYNPRSPRVLEQAKRVCEAFNDFCSS